MLNALLKREEYLCFYCLADVTENNCELDHVVPQSQVEDNSYRNIVVSCHACNRKKGDQEVSSYLRTLLRQNLLDEVEFQSRIEAIKTLKSGELLPII